MDLTTVNCSQSDSPRSSLFALGMLITYGASCTVSLSRDLTVLTYICLYTSYIYVLCVVINVALPLIKTQCIARSLRASFDMTA